MAEYIVQADNLEALENGFYSIGNSGEPVVRCKDCTEWERNYTNRARPNVHPCRAGGHATTADFFCGLGERMNEVDNG